MKKYYFALFALLFAAATKTLAQSASGQSVGSNNLVKVDPSAIDPKISNMLNFYDKQIYFTENRGQWPDSILYKADFPLGQALVTTKGMVVGTYDAKAYAAHNAQYERKEQAEHDGVKFNEEEVKVPGHGWLMNFINHSADMHIESKTRHSDYFNYFNTKDATKYATNVGSYQEIWYRNVYDNVDVRYYPSETGTLEYDIVCNPGFNKNEIAIQLDGISSIHLNANGHLVLGTSVGDMDFPAAVAYQKINGVKTSVEAKYVIKNNVIHFELGNYDATQPLIIDPIALRWATWMTNNSTAANHNHCIWVDQSTGYIYVIARVASSGLISVNAIQNTYKGGTTGGDENEIGEYIEPDTIGNPGERVWQTYLGNAGENNPYALEQAANGDLIFTGYTQSTDYPLLGGTQYSGTSINDAASSSSEKIFITKINTAGTSFKSAVIGGNGNDAPFDLRTTSTSDVLVCGNTTSTNLATVFPGSGATNTTGHGEDVIVFRINNDLSAITWMRNYGGTGSDGATIMNTNQTTGDIFVAGTTTSTNFPVSTGARQAIAGGSTNSFIQKLNSSGNVVWSSYFNAASGKSAQILCMELNTTQTSVYFAGLTTGLATGNISTSKVIQPTISGTTDFFVAKMDTNQNFDEATYLGGGSEINMMGLNTDLNNDVYILGYTASTNFPVTSSDALQTTNKASKGNDNETFTKLRTDLDSLDYSTYYGGSVDDYDPVGERGIKFFNCRIFTVFTSESNDVPLTQGAITTTKLSTSSIYEPGIVVWANPPDLANNTITNSEFVCSGSEPGGFTGSVPSYILPNINRNGTISSYPVTLSSATTYQWQFSTDSVNWTDVTGGTTQNLSSTQIGPLYQTTYFRRIIGGDACIIAGAAEQTITVKISSVGGTVTNVSCFEGKNGAITANPTGPSPYSFKWNNGATSQTITGLDTGKYTVTVTDGAGCTYSNSFAVTQPTLLQESIVSSNIPTSCNGTNGSATAAAATGGTKPYTYKWSPSGGTGLTASGLSAGTYTITATDSNGCTATANVVIAPYVSSLSASITSQTSACYNQSNGSATVTASNGKKPYTYSWNTVPVQTGATATNLAAGTYTVTVTDSNTCTTTQTVVITQPSAALNASISANSTIPVSCFGNSNGSAWAIVSGGTAPYKFSWNTAPAQSADTAINLAAGSYTVTVTDANGCSASANVTISQPSAPLNASISANSTIPVSCFGNSNGSAWASVSGGTAPYKYSWNTIPAQSADTAINLAAGSYTVTVTDANGCSASANVTISQPSAPLNASISANSTIPVSCFGNSNGSAWASVSGGTPPYKYSWNTTPAQSADTAINLAAGSYTVTVTDANGCSASANVTISQPSAPLNASISANSTIPVSCFGNSNGSAWASVSGGTPPYKYSWNTTPAQSADTAINLAAGSYTVTVTDANGCSASANVTISQPSAPLNASISANSTIPVSCFGNSNGSAWASVSGGTAPYKYSWNTTPAQSSDTAINLAAGSYTVTVTDANGCSASANVTISQPSAPLNASISANSTIPVSCFGNSNGSAWASVSGGTAPYKYSWNTIPAQSADTAINLAAGSYTVTVTDANGCSASANVTISQPSAPLNASISANSTIPVSCFGNSNGSAWASVGGGTAPYKYSWNTTPAQSADTAINLAAGSYTVTVTDANGCSASANVTISQPSAPLNASISANSTIPVSCFGNSNGSAWASVSGGTPPYKYSWNTTPAQSADTAINLAAGSYTVTVTDANGCSASANVTISQPSAPLNASISANSTIPVSCFGNSNGSAWASVSGGTAPYKYSWNTTPAQSADTAINLAAGSYTVTVTDANGCSASANVTISQPSAPLNASISANSTIPVSCFGNSNGSAWASVSGGTPPYKYSWNTTPAQSADTAINLAAGSYTVTVTDANGCSASANVSISQPQAALNASISSTTNVSCFGGSGSATVSVNGGTAPYTYSWNTNPAQTGATANDLSAGTYTVNVTDSNGCTTSASVVISQPQGALNASISSTIAVSCFGEANGSATVNVNGGTAPYKYSWNTNPVQTQATANNLAAGTYTVTITDSLGCFTSVQAAINQPSAALKAKISSDISVACYSESNGSAVVSVSGGTQPYTYSWNTNPAQSGDTAKNLSAGTYTVTVTDSNGCTTTENAVIAQPIEALNASIYAQNNVSCFGGNNGSATVIAKGGTPTHKVGLPAIYTYSWNTSPVQSGSTATNLSAGTYTVTVTDSAGCTTTSTVIISQPKAALSAAISLNVSASCFGNNNGMAAVSVSGGTTPYSYSWNTNPVQIGDTANSLAAGTYTVTVTDSNGCIASMNVAVSQPQAALSASISSMVPVSCFGNNNGSATVNVSGGTTPYTYSWNTTPSQTGTTASNLSAGTYTVNITDSNGCTTSANVVIAQPQAALNAAISSQTNVSCFGGAGSAIASVSGGTKPYSYSWNTTPAQTGDTASNLEAGTYTVNIIDSNGCTTSATVVITQPAGALNVAVTSSVPVSCFGNSNGSATATASMGTPPYVYSWNTTPVQTNATATNLIAGTYTVTVSDSGGCINTASVVISQPQSALNASISSNLPVSCFGNSNGSATVSVSGGTTPYAYSWNTTPAQTSATASNLSAGTYTVNITDSNGCTTLANVVIGQPMAALSATITSQIPVACFGNTTGSASVGVSGGTQPYSYSWNTTPAQTGAIATNLSAGTYTVTIIDSNNCSTTATAIISQPAAAINVVINSPATNVCNGSPITLSAAVTGGTGSYSFNWTPGGAIIDSIVVNPTVTTTYSVVVTDSNNCTNTGTITINVNQLPVVSVGANPLAVCLGNSDTLKASGAASYTWSPATGLNSTQGSLVLANPTVSTTYTITGTNGIGCSNTTTATVVVNPLPKVSISGLDSSYCGNSSSAVTLIGIPPANPPLGEYSGAGGVMSNGLTGIFYPDSAGGSGIYNITYKYTNDTTGCSNTASLPVTILPAPNVTITTNNPNICLGNSTTLVASGANNYVWIPSSGLSCSSCSSTVATPTATTTYTVDGSIGNCSATATVTVGVFSISVKAGPDQHILYGSSAQLTASGADYYVWTPANTLNNDSISDPIASPTVTTTYTVTGKDSLGCISVDTVVIYVSNPCESLKIPSGFTPAGNDNRYFHVLNVGGAELQEFRVFNRWGQMVYETTEIDAPGWDGTFGGKPQPMGTYVYYAEILCQGQTVFIKGDVTLIR